MSNDRLAGACVWGRKQGVTQTTTRRGGDPPRKPRPPDGTGTTGRALEKRRPRPVDLRPPPPKRFLRRGWPLYLAIAAIVLVLLPAIGLGLLHLRLRQGPINVGFLVAPIEAAINDEIAPLRARIAGATVRYDGSDIRFRLEDVRIYDARRSLVALAPQAAVQLSGRALISGRIAPASIDLIGPALLLRYSSEDGLTISATPSVLPGGQAGSDEDEADPASVATTRGGAQGRTIALVRTASEALSAARQQSSASSYLSRLGLTEAQLVFDHAGKRSSWKIPRLSLRLEHRQKRSAITADGEIATSSGLANVGFTLEQSDKTRQLNLVATVAGLVPSDFAKSLPEFTALAAFGMPISGEMRFDLDEAGDVVTADADLDLGQGPVLIASVGAKPFSLQSGEISAHYSAEDGYLQIRPSRIATGSSRATLSGIAVPRKAGADLNIWDFRLALADAALGDSEAGLEPLAIEDWTVKGTFAPQSGLLVLEHMRVKSDGGTFDMTAELSAERGVHGEAVLGSMSTALFTRLWPATLGPGARRWVSQNLKAGRITKGSFKVALDPRQIAAIDTGAELPEEAIAGALQTQGVEVTYLKGLPALTTTSALIRLAGTRFSAEVAGGTSDLGDGRKVILKSGSFTIAHILAEPAEGEARFAVAGDMASVTDFLDREPLDYMSAIGIEPGEVSGEGNGSFTLKLPLIDDVRFRDVELKGEAALRELRSRTAFEGFPLDGGSVDLTLTPKSIEANGELILSGVSADLRWVRFLGPGNGAQPPLRVSAKLDATDRQQLGLAVNHVLVGVLPVTVMIDHDAKGGRKIAVQADLTDAELVLDNLAWRKPPGEAATAQFDVVAVEKGRTLLDNFRIFGQGSDIAIAGRLTLGADRRLIAFEFPNFAMNVLTLMRLSGTLDKSNIWQVKAVATRYDGRPFFRSLFSAGRITDRPPEATKGVSDGIDVEAEIKTMVGFADTSLEDVRISMQRRDGKLSALRASGLLPAGRSIAVRLEAGEKGDRQLVATTDDAGSAFRLVNFYRNVEGGTATLRVELEGSRGSERNGFLKTNDFIVATSDAVVSGMISEAGKRVNRKKVDVGQGQSTGYYFKQLRVPFSVGSGKLVLHDSQINGPAIGATIAGTVDFERQRVDLAGDYFPFYGVNSIVQPVPFFGDVLAGGSGEAIFGLSYKISGALANPNVAINPISALMPGVLRKIFSFEAPEGPILDAPSENATLPPSLASSLPPMTGEETQPTDGTPSVGDALPAMVAGQPQPASRTETAGTGQTKPRKKVKSAVETLEGWGSQTKEK